ncbi:MAG: Na+/H+ antiporter subunit E [Planctomycetes bacterium]|nr:Na+/H+ antiporter subunit E [Planctomycetota bacterium]
MKWLLCLFLVFALWMLLMWSLDPLVIGTGAFFALLVGTYLGDIYPEQLHKVFSPKRWLFFILYVPYFLYYCVRANLDVAFRVLHPDVPIRPGIVRIRTTLTGDMAKTFLANSITLTPGTLTIDIDGQDLYIHCINVPPGDIAKRSREICGTFEPLLRRIFE